MHLWLNVNCIERKDIWLHNFQPSEGCTNQRLMTNKHGQCGRLGSPSCDCFRKSQTNETEIDLIAKMNNKQDIECWNCKEKGHRKTEWNKSRPKRDTVEV